MKCKFCEWDKHYKKLYENEHAVAVWGSPYVRGHVKVILKRHADNLTELSKEESCAMMDVWIVVGRVLEAVIKPDIINWQINCNWTRHIHGHIYPRWHPDSDWGEPIRLPTHEQERNKTYVAKELTREEKTKIEDLLFHKT